MPSPFKQIIADENTVASKLLEPLDMLPRGAALVTSSGDLGKQGIVSIIQAATGSMKKRNGIFEPNKKSIENSILNSFNLFYSNQWQSMAFPFLGGGVFKDRIGVTTEELATTIISAVIDQMKSEPIKIVLFKQSDFDIFADIIDQGSYEITSDELLALGDICDFKTHQCEVIVNAANMAVEFGGGLSKVIGKATNNAKAIDQEAKKEIRNYYLHA